MPEEISHMLLFLILTNLAESCLVFGRHESGLTGSNMSRVIAERAKSAGPCLRMQVPVEDSFGSEAAVWRSGVVGLR